MAAILRVLAALLALTFPAPTFAGDEDLLKVSAVREEQATQLYAENFDRVAPRWAELSLSESVNLVAEPALPLRFVLAPGERRLVATLRRVVPTRAMRYSYRYTHGPGDPLAVHDDKTAYLLPYAHGSKHVLTQGYFGRTTHARMNALDFDLPEGTPVHAARAGIVREIREDATKGGPDLAAEDGNYIRVQHDDGTWAVYAHLKPLGVSVKIGQRVAAGERIGYSGATGLASGPHLHFAVLRASWSADAITLPTRFRTRADGPAEALDEGRAYYSYHPGGPAFVPVLGELLREEDLRMQSRPASGGDFRVRQERIDRRVLLWGANGTADTVVAQIDLTEIEGATPRARTPFVATVPPRTEVFLFSVDLAVNASFRVNTRFQRVSAAPVQPGVARPGR